MSLDIRPFRFVSLLCIFATFVLGATPGQANPNCNGYQCLMNPGNPYGDGFNYFVNNYCPAGCNLEKHNAGHSCYTGGNVHSDYCSDYTVGQHWWYTSTSTCLDNECDFSHSSWSESTGIEQTSTCVMRPCNDPYLG